MMLATATEIPTEHVIRVTGVMPHSISAAYKNTDNYVDRWWRPDDIMNYDGFVLSHPKFNYQRSTYEAKLFLCHIEIAPYIDQHCMRFVSQ